MSESRAPTLGDDHFIDEPSKASPVKRPHPPQSPTLTTPTVMQTMRRRLDTEETHRIKNIMLPLMNDPNSSSIVNQSSFATDETMSNANANANSSDFPPEEDDNTIVSSLSNDEDSLVVARRNSVLTPIIESENSLRNMLLPVEVEIPASGSQVDQGNSLMERLVAKLAVRQTSPPPVLTRSLSSLVERPTLGRNRSCPVRMDFSVASSMPSNRSGTTYSIPEDSIIINGALIEGVRSRDGDFSSGENSNDAGLLGYRKRRVHHRVHSGTEISVGSIVGQSTLFTATSSTASISESDASSVRKALRSAHIAEEMLLSVTGASDGIACCQVRRPKNVVKEELKYVAGKLTSPIRMLPMFKEKKAELKRAKGSLV